MTGLGDGLGQLCNKAQKILRCAAPQLECITEPSLKSAPITFRRSPRGHQCSARHYTVQARWGEPAQKPTIEVGQADLAGLRLRPQRLISWPERSKAASSLFFEAVARALPNQPASWIAHEGVDVHRFALHRRCSSSGALPAAAAPTAPDVGHPLVQLARRTKTHKRHRQLSCHG
jgi:hypothetical protein